MSMAPSGTVSTVLAPLEDARQAGLLDDQTEHLSF